MYRNSIYNTNYSFSSIISYKVPQVSIAHKVTQPYKPLLPLEPNKMLASWVATSRASSWPDLGTGTYGDGVWADATDPYDRKDKM
jgi:hypothetical protein